MNTIISTEIVQHLIASHLLAIEKHGFTCAKAQGLARANLSGIGYRINHAVHF